MGERKEVRETVQLLKQKFNSRLKNKHFAGICHLELYHSTHIKAKKINNALCIKKMKEAYPSSIFNSHLCLLEQPINQERNTEQGDL